MDPHLAIRGWTGPELRALWRALLALPLEHTAEGTEIRTFLRQAVAEDAESLEGYARCGRYDPIDGAITLYNAAFGWEHTGYSLEEVVAHFVGEALWLRYRVPTQIEDQQFFAELYSAFYLAPESLAEYPEALERLGELLVARPDNPDERADIASVAASAGAGLLPAPPPDVFEPRAAAEAVDDDVARRAVEDFVAIAYPPDGQGFYIDEPPGPLGDAAVMAPWRFYRVRRDAGQGRRALPVDLVLAYAGPSDEVMVASDASFERFVREVGHPGDHPQMTPERLLCAWHTLTKGHFPTLARLDVEPPNTVFHADGASLTMGWTGEDRVAEKAQRHWLQITPEGGVEAWTDGGGA